MSRFYSIMVRAIADLSGEKADARRALYEQAQAALMAELASSKPPPSAEYIDSERRALSSAIRRIEAESARVRLEAVLARPKSATEIVPSQVELEDVGFADNSAVVELVELLPD